MGQTLICAAQWTSAKESFPGKLEVTPLNEELLNSICNFVDGFSERYPDEARLTFKKPLIWETKLTPNNFHGFREVDGILRSDDEKDGEPLFRLQKQNIGIMTLAFGERVLKCAGEKKINELRHCLEANRDPVVRMLGDRFATVQCDDNSILRYVDEIRRSTDTVVGTTVQQVEKQEQVSSEKNVVLSLLLKLVALDQELLNKSILNMSKQVRLNSDIVENEMNVLEDLFENEDDKALESITYCGENFVYKNGCRAPPWRQLHGDICYVEVKLGDHDKPLFITANTGGYFLNKGHRYDQDEELDYDRCDNDTFRDLVSLLTAKSSRFGDIVSKQGFSLHPKHDHAVEVIESKKDSDYNKVHSDNLIPYSSEADHDLNKNKKFEYQSKRLEPSLKWKSLDMAADASDDAKPIHEVSSATKRTDSSRKQKATVHHNDLFSESSSESEEEEEETPDRRIEANSDLPSEYWQIQKLVKYLKGGNQVATIIALCSLRDFNLSQEACQLAIRDVGGLEVLINLLDTEELKCKIGALKILKEISCNVQIRRSIADLGGLQTMVKILCEPDLELKCLAAETIANVARFRRARRTVRQHNGIKKLVTLLDCDHVHSPNMTEDMQVNVEVARCGALALWSCSRSKRNKQAMQQAGAIPLLARLLKSLHQNMLIPVVGTLQECASETNYRLAIRTEGMVEDLVKNLNCGGNDEDIGHSELQKHCASAIFKCAEEKETRDLVRQYGGLDPLVALLSRKQNTALLEAVTGAIWKCAISPENVSRLQQLKCVELLVALLDDQPEEVLVNVVGALGELAKSPVNCVQIRKSGGIPSLVDLLTGTNKALLVNVTRAVGQCAVDVDNMAIIDRLDGVRLLWSLLKNHNPEVQASAAWAICPCIEGAKDAGEMVRSFVGGLELIVSLLKSEHSEVLAAVCAAIANIAKDEENLAVITDHGVVPMLAKLTSTNDDTLRQHLAEAIACCCSWGTNRAAFGMEGAVAPLVRYLKSKDETVYRSTSRALFQLSKHPQNCITMHEAGVVQPLIKMVGAADDDLQESAAGCIGNIRRLALSKERRIYA